MFPHPTGCKKAGGTRFHAVQHTDLKSVPVVLHEGFTDEQIVKLADEDNENDEYHTKVPIVDVWLSYLALAEQGWTQERIANAKGVKQPVVAAYLQYAAQGEAVLQEFIKNDFLKDSHAAEICKLSNFYKFDAWLTREAAMLEVIESVLKKCTKAAPPTAKNHV